MPEQRAISSVVVLWAPVTQARNFYLKNLRLLSPLICPHCSMDLYRIDSQLNTPDLIYMTFHQAKFYTVLVWFVN